MRHQRIKYWRTSAWAGMSLMSVFFGTGRAFELPKDGAEAIWEAEAANKAGKWTAVKHGWASGGAYVEPRTPEGNRLEFEFNADRPTLLRVRPLFWRNSQRLPARDNPAPSLLGEERTIIGWLASSVTNASGTKLYVADLTADRLLVFDLKARKTLKAIKLPSAASALAVKGTKVYAACWQSKTIAVIDTEKDELAAKAELAIRPAMIAVQGDELIVWPLLMGLEPLTQKDLEKYRLDYAFGHDTRLYYGAGYHHPHVSYAAIAGPHLVKLAEEYGHRSTNISVKEVTGLAEGQPGAPPFENIPGPLRVANIGGMQSGGLFFFTAPASGKVGMINFHQKKLAKILDVGGYPWDIAGPYLSDSTGEAAQPLTRKLYVTDPKGKRVIILDGEKGAVLGEVKLTSAPWEVDAYAKYVFVGCEDKLVVIDSLTDKVEKEIALPEKMTRMEVINADVADVYGGGGGSRGKYPWFTSTSKPELLIKFPALKLDLAALKKTGNADLAMPVAPQAAGAAIRIMDPKQEQCPLSDLATLGTICLAMDDPAVKYDWRRNLWNAAVQGGLLVYDTAEYWQWNALSFPLQPGKHKLIVSANNAYGQLDAVVVWKDLAGQVAASIAPEPTESEGVFAAGEPAQFKVGLRNLGPGEQNLRLSYEVGDYLGREVGRGAAEVKLPALGSNAAPLKFELKDPGRFCLKTKLESGDGKLEQEFCFARAPERRDAPSLFFRRGDVPAIAARIKKYDRLFARYGAWLKKQIAENKFLPETLALRETNGDFEQEFHLIAAQFAAFFLEPKDFFKTRMQAIMDRSTVDGKLNIRVQHLDLEARILDAVFDIRALGEADRGIKPLSPEERKNIRADMGRFNGMEKFFGIHAGKRGGTFGYNPWTTCSCPQRLGIWPLYKWTRSLGEDQEFSKPIFRGYFTFERYVPEFYKLITWETFHHDHANPWRREPMRMIWALASRNPIERLSYGWDEWSAAMSREQLAEEELEVLFQRPFAYLFPMLLACGLYDPAQPAVDRAAFPKSVYFDGEGVVCLRSSWDTNATEVFFASGLRDVAPRYPPNHFMIVKNGEFLASSAATDYDHGSVVAMWANSVAVGDEWQARWQEASGDNRSYELQVYDRYAGGGVYFHQHIDSPLAREGEIVAYKTTPDYDYAAGDATQGWPVEKVREVYRQLVYLKPDVVVIYDRVKLRADEKTQWLLCPHPNRFSIQGNIFRVSGVTADLCGNVVLPADGKLEPLPLTPWDADASSDQGPRYEVITIKPPRKKKEVEYLVVLNVGPKGLAPLAVKPAAQGELAGVEFKYNARDIRVLFRKDGAVGGKISIADAKGRIQENLAERVEDQRHAILGE